MEWFLYLGVGVASGILAGLFGIGGGLIIIPLLIYILLSQGVNPDVITHLAVGTSLAIIIFTSITAVLAQNKRKAINWPIFLWMAVGILLGSFLGAKTASYIDGKSLQKIIGVFALCIAAELLFEIMRQPKAQQHLTEKNIPKPIFTLSGIVIGWASAIFGIGGGSLTVPFLNWCHFPMQKAAGTSSACALPIAITGAAGYLWAGWGNAALPNWSVGYIYLPALLGIATTSSIFARLGVKLAYRLSARMLKGLFALLLICIACSFLFGVAY